MTASLTYDIGSRGALPLYEFLYRSIRDDILEGRLTPGEKLPSKRTLSRSLGVSISTIENALRQLVLEGYLESRQRSGHYVQDVGDLPFAPKAKGAEPNNMIDADRVPATPNNTSNAVRTDLDAIDPLDELIDESGTTLKANRTGFQEFPLATWFKLMRKVIAENPPDLFDTVPYNGLPVLRNAIARYLLRSRGMKVSPANIIIGAGTEYLYGRILQLLSPNTLFAFENPGYHKLSHIADNQRISWTFCNVDSQGLNVESLRALKADAVHVSPANNFPSGITMPVGRRRELLRWAYEKPERFIIEDDYDSELRYTGNIMLPLFASDTHERVIYLNTFSKTLMPSLRISYMILPDPLLQRYRETMSFYSCTVSGFEQRTLAKFIDEGYLERHIVRLRNYYRKQREAVMQAIRGSRLNEKCRIIENNAGTHFLLYVETKMMPSEIKRAAQRNDLELALLSDYSFKSYPIAEKIVVVNYASLSDDNVAETVEKLARVFSD